MKKTVLITGSSSGIGKALSSSLFARFQQALTAIYADERAEHSLPSVAALAEKLALSPKYLSDLLKAETGKTAQEHIRLFVVNEAKTCSKSRN